MRTPVDIPRNSERAEQNWQIPKVLCIDDDPDISRAIQLRLNNFEIEVKRTFHGMQGVAVASQEKPDVIITDLRMPMGEGEFVLSDPDIPET